MARVYHSHPDRDGTAPRTFGPLGRLDPHDPGDGAPSEDPEGRGVLYLAADLPTALAEAFPGQWPEVRICENARVVWVSPHRPAPLLDLTSDGAMAIGAVGTLLWGDEPRELTQRWARSIHEQYDDLVGIYYRTAHQGGGAVALWERGPALHLVGAEARSLWSVKDHLTVALAGQGRVPVVMPATDCSACLDAGY